MAALLGAQSLTSVSLIQAKEEDSASVDEFSFEPAPNPDGDYSDYSSLLKETEPEVQETASISLFNQIETLSASHNEQIARLIRTIEILENEIEDSAEGKPGADETESGSKETDPSQPDDSQQPGTSEDPGISEDPGKDEEEQPPFDGTIYDNKSLYELSAELDRIQKEIEANPDQAKPLAGALQSLKDHIKALETVSMNRMYNPNTGEHFYTAETKEKDFLVSKGWKYEGIGWLAPKNGGDEVYRLYNPTQGDHHYTTDAKERKALIAAGWKDEGIGWYSCEASDAINGAPLYRQYNANQYAWNHNFTTSFKETDFLTKNGWKDEGIAWYGIFPVSRVAGDNSTWTFYDNSTGQPLSGEQNIAGDIYYFDPAASCKMTTGRKWINDIEYIFDSNGRMLFGWQNLEGHRLYMDQGSGKVTKGYYEASRTDKYYFDDKGYMVTNRTVSVKGENMTFGADGKKVLTPEELTANSACEIVNQVGRDPQKLFLWLIDNVSYVTLPIHVPTEPGWNLDQTYAMRAFKERTGNCYCYANGYAYLLRELGYNAKAFYGKTKNIYGQILDHGWTEVEIDGKWYICDGSFARYYRDKAISHCYMQDRDHPKWSYIR